MRELLRHLGEVHRWAGTHVREAGPDLVVVKDQVELFGAWPGDAALVDWFRAEPGLLVESLTAADPDLACATFLPAPSPLHFWARRQAHETTIHRVDVESVAGSVGSVAAGREDNAIELANCTVRGPAADLYLALWNRRGVDDLRVEGDVSLLALFREKVTIRWS